MLSITFRGDQTVRQGRLVHVFIYNTDAQITENYQRFIRFLLETIYSIWQQRSLSKLQIAPNFIKENTMASILEKYQIWRWWQLRYANINILSYINIYKNILNCKENLYIILNTWN